MKDETGRDLIVIDPKDQPYSVTLVDSTSKTIMKFADQAEEKSFI
jgi:hypothetical protein